MPEKLKQYGVSMSSIASDIAGSDITYPAGDTQVGDQKLSVSTEQPFETMDSLNDIPLTVSGGQTVYLSDVARYIWARMMWKVLRVIRLRTDFPRISWP